MEAAIFMCDSPKLDHGMIIETVLSQRHKIEQAIKERKLAYKRNGHSMWKRPVENYILDMSHLSTPKSQTSKADS
jgi:hypothetical protein